MKKYYSILIAAAVLLISACNKNEIPAPEENLDGLVEMTFKATTDPTTKTSLGSDGLSVEWNSEDAISILAGGSNCKFTVTEGQSGQTVTFTGSAPESSVYYAVYPYNAEATLTGNTIATEVPAQQPAAAGSFAANSALTVAKADSEANLYFRNVCSYVGISADVDLAEIVLTSTEDKALAGGVNVTLADDGAITTSVTKPSTSVSIVGNLAANTVYYLSILPGTYAGLKITFRDADGNESSLTNNVSTTFNRNGIRNLPTFTVDTSKWLKSYVLNGYDEVAAFLDGYDGKNKEDVINLTVTGNDVTKDQVSDLYLRVNNIFGTLTIDGTGTNQYNSDDWDDSIHFAIERMNCKGGIVIRNILGIMKLQALSKYNGVINGDFIIENCNVVTNWNNDCTQLLKEIKGDFKIINKIGSVDSNFMKNLVRVEGDFVFSGNSGIWNFSDYDSEHPLKYIGGNVVIENNPDLWNINAFENLEHIGGDVIIMNNNPKFPVKNGNVDGSDCRGFCLISDFLANGVISDTANVTLGSDSNPVNFDLLPTCSGTMRPVDVVLASKADFNTLRGGGSKVIAKSLTITAADMSVSNVNDVWNYIESIEGTITIDGAASGDEGWMNIDNLCAISSGKGVVLRNLSANVDVKGLKSFTEIDGDLIIENCPRTYFRDGRSSTDLATITNITGDVILGGVFNDGLQSILQSLTHIGGDLIVRNVDNPDKNVYVTMESLTAVDGDIVIDNVTLNVFNHGAAMLAKVANVGGDVILSNITKGDIGSRGDNAAFTSLKNVGGDFSMTNVAGLKRFYNGMSLDSIGGDLIINGNPNFKSFGGFENITRIGGNVSILDNSSEWVIANGDDKNVGLCNLRDMIDLGIISPNATVVYGTSSNIQDAHNLTGCMTSYSITGRDELLAFWADYSGNSAGVETVLNLTIDLDNDSNIAEDDLRRIYKRVKTVRGTFTLKNSGSDVNTDNNLFSSITYNGSIIFENVSMSNANGFRKVPVVKGDLIFRDCLIPMTQGWNPFDAITEVKGDLILDNVNNNGVNGTSSLDNFNFDVLEKVGGDLRVNNCNHGFWNFGGAPKINYIGGSLIVTNCSQFGIWYDNNQYLKSSLTHLGGVVILDTDSGTGRGNYCAFRDMLENGVLPAGAQTLFGNTGDTFTVAEVNPCN